MAKSKRPAFRKHDRVTLAPHKRVIPPYDGKPFVLRDTVLAVSHLTGTGSTRNPWHVVVTDGTHFWHLEPDDVTPVETGGGGTVHSTIKKPGKQLDREIAASLAKPRSHTTIKKTKAARPTPYRLKLTPSEISAISFAKGRYAWPDMLAAHAAEDGSIAFTESEMWQWTDDVDSDAAGGHSPFPLAHKTFVEKLQRFYDSRV